MVQGGEGETMKCKDGGQCGVGGYCKKCPAVADVKWDRRLWGVKFSSHNGGQMLIGEAWHNSMITSRHIGEPTRPLLFTTRAAARDWCHSQMGKYKGRNDCCADWVFTPVRVRELVDVVR